MIRATAVAALAASMAVAGCCSTGYARPPGPAVVSPSNWGRAVLRVHAVGVQMYVVVEDAGGARSLKLTGPRATLFDENGREVGTHFRSDSGPAWEIGSVRITGRKLRERSSRDPADVPELELAATVTGSGDLASVTVIERLGTNGGAAPALDASMMKDQVVEVPYTADYVFYALAN